VKRNKSDFCCVNAVHTPETMSKRKPYSALKRDGHHCHALFTAFFCTLYGFFMLELMKFTVARAGADAMYQLSVVAIGVVSVAFFVLILAGLLHEMARHKRKKL
jgi:hypothetical protein